MRQLLIQKKQPGNFRTPGVPTIRDRVTHTSAMLVLAPIFEPFWHGCDWRLETVLPNPHGRSMLWTQRLDLAGSHFEEVRAGLHRAGVSKEGLSSSSTIPLAEKRLTGRRLCVGLTAATARPRPECCARRPRASLDRYPPRLPVCWSPQAYLGISSSAWDRRIWRGLRGWPPADHCGSLGCSTWCGPVVHRRAVRPPSPDRSPTSTSVDPHGMASVGRGARRHPDLSCAALE